MIWLGILTILFFFFLILSPVVNTARRFVLGLLNHFFINCDRDMAQVLCKHAMKIAAIGNVRFKNRRVHWDIGTNQQWRWAAFMNTCYDATTTTFKKITWGLNEIQILCNPVCYATKDPVGNRKRWETELCMLPFNNKQGVFNTQFDVDTIGDLYRTHSLLYEHA